MIIIYKPLQLVSQHKIVEQKKNNIKTNKKNKIYPTTTNKYYFYKPKISKFQKKKTIK